MHIDAVTYFDETEKVWVAHALVLDIVCVSADRETAIEDLREFAQAQVNHCLKYKTRELLRMAPDEVWDMVKRPVEVKLEVVE